MRRERVLALLLDRRFLLGLFVVTTIVASVHKVLTDQHNNYLIFYHSFQNLVDGVDIYEDFSDDRHWDVFKYSPTFALAMGPLTLLPIWLGAVLWNLLNAVPLFFGIDRLVSAPQRKAAALWIVYVQLLTNTQNFQSNGLTAALFLWTFIALERGRMVRAALFVMAGAFLKIYGAAAAALGIFYVGRWRFAAAGLLWGVVLWAAPLVFVSPQALLDLYASWSETLQRDAGNMYGISFLGLVHNITGVDLPRRAIQVLALVVMLGPLLQVRAWGDRAFRHAFLSTLLVWVVIFNHMAESSTYVIALTGVALWITDHEARRWEIGLVVLAVLLTSLSPQDFVPRAVQREYIERYALKALPCVLIWFVMMARLLRWRTPPATR